MLHARPSLPYFCSCAYLPTTLTLPTRVLRSRYANQMSYCRGFRLQESNWQSALDHAFGPISPSTYQETRMRSINVTTRIL